MTKPQTADPDPYDRIAAWYDLEHDSFQEDAECYVSLVGANAGPRARVLEVGGGTGRLAVAFALAGHPVTAVEPSVAMSNRAAARLRQLPEKVARRVPLVTGSAGNLGLAPVERFGAALMAQNLLAHLLIAEERERALASAANALRPGGQLILDVDLAGPQRLLQASSRPWRQGTWSLRDGCGEVTHFVAASLSYDARIVHLIHSYDVTGADGAVSRTSARMSLAMLSAGEVELALRHAGFTIEAIYGDYGCAPYEAGSERAIFDARLDTTL
ncbi:MAG: methyltransferase domain-containing protein [Ktedonobacterales bacterium]